MKNLIPRAGTIAAIFIISTVPIFAEDMHLQAAGPIGLGYVGIYYGLANPSTGTWYEGEDLFGNTSTTWLAVADTGSSACILGKSTQDAYALRTAIPLQPYPDVHFSDVGFGGMEDFAVTEPVQIMVADFKSADNDTENHSLYYPVGPIGVNPPATRMAAARDYIGGGAMDFDIIGMSVMEGKVLEVDPHYLQFLRWTYIAMAGTISQTPPPAPSSGVLYIPVTMQSFFDTPQSADVGKHPMVMMKIRKAPTDNFAERLAVFDSGSPVNFVSESFAAEAGIDLSAPADLSITVLGVGGEQTTRPGYYIDTLALELAGTHQNDELLISNTAVFIIPDDDMPCGLDAILGSNILSPSSDMVDTTIQKWFLDMRDEENAFLVIVIPEPATMLLILLAFPTLLKRHRTRRR
ncbi:MAG: retropepsin-like domain-containing protein [Planctomycetes bacterium]|nr:retropepsin-like domain-containing protein [Planctomycetota bacterium]